MAEDSADSNAASQSAENEHTQAAKKAADTAARLVASNSGIEAFKRVVVRDTDVQDRLAATSDQEEFIETAVALAAQHGFTFTVDEARDHLREMEQHHSASMTLSAEPDATTALSAESDASTAFSAEPDPSTNPPSRGPSLVGCSSQNTVSNPSYSIQCGLSTQKCLCTL